MKFKTLYKEVQLPVLGLGTWKMGGEREADYSKDEETIQLIKDAIKIGYTHLDTAEMYGVGHTEELIGQAIKDFDRDTLFITSKVHAKNLKYDDVIASTKASLKRLDTQYIDLYLLHAPNNDIPIQETMRAMDYVLEQKLVRFIGLSNFNLDEMKAAQKCTKNKIVVNQIEYSLLTRNNAKYGNNKNMELETLPYCQEHDILVMTERPVERGLLLLPHPLMDELADKYGKSKAQIAINWLVSKKNVVTIPMSSNLKHLQENLDALEFSISNEDLKRLDKIDFGDLKYV